jgi:hypothetical protein
MTYTYPVYIIKVKYRTELTVVLRDPLRFDETMNGLASMTD